MTRMTKNPKRALYVLYLHGQCTNRCEGWTLEEAERHNANMKANGMDGVWLPFGEAK